MVPNRIESLSSSAQDLEVRYQTAVAQLQEKQNDAEDLQRRLADAEVRAVQAEARAVRAEAEAEEQARQRQALAGPLSAAKETQVDELATAKKAHQADLLLLENKLAHQEIVHAQLTAQAVQEAVDSSLVAQYESAAVEVANLSKLLDEQRVQVKRLESLHEEHLAKHTSVVDEHAATVDAWQLELEKSAAEYDALKQELTDKTKTADAQHADLLEQHVTDLHQVHQDRRAHCRCRLQPQ